MIEGQHCVLPLFMLKFILLSFSILAMKTVSCTTIDGSIKEVPVDELTLRAQLYGIIINDKSEVLLVPNWDGFDFPGGGIDLGETFEEAFSREIVEETGLIATMDKIFYTDGSFFYHPNKEKGFQTILMYATAKDVSGEISTKNLDVHEKDYAGEAKWFSLEEAKALKFHNDVDSVELIRQAIEKK